MRRQHRVYTKEENEIMRRYYPYCDCDEMMRLLPGRDLKSIASRAHRMGLKKKVRFVHGQPFKKGMTPPNKGVPRQEWMSPENIERCRKTMFPKGHVPHTLREIGSERIEKDGYKYRKVGEKQWKQVHRIVWEQHHGPIPKGYNIVMKDGNRLNTDISNLEMVSNAELMNRNSYHNRYPEEVRHLFQLKGALNRQINKNKNK